MHIKRSITGFIGIFVALCILFSSAEPASAASSYSTYFEYRGEEKVDEYSALSSFTEDNINYRVTERPSGGKYGKVYVSGCKFKLETLDIPAVVKHSGAKYDVVGINDMAFKNYENLTKVTIEDGPTYIGGGAFWGCWYLKSIKLPKTLKELGESAFGYCGSLKEITFPDAITKIPDSVCRDSGVEKVTLGKKVTSIESNAFYNCLKLKEITLPASIKSINNYAFCDCHNLAKITNKTKLSNEELTTVFKSTKWGADRAKPAYEHNYSDTDIPLSVTLDNKRYSKGYLYYRMNDFERETRGLSYDDWDHGYYKELAKDSDGNYILDKNLVADTYYPVSGEFYYCEKKPKDFLKDYKFKFSTNDIPSYNDLSTEMYEKDTKEAEKIRAEQGDDAYYAYNSSRKSAWDYYKEIIGDPVTIALYTVHFDSGKTEARFLPDEDMIVSKYSQASLGDRLDLFLSGYGRVEHPMAAAKAFAYYADSKGNKIDKIRGISEPLTVHPVFVNEDELYTGEDYACEQDYYYSWFKRDSDNWQSFKPNVKIKSGAELIGRFLYEPSKKDGMAIIDKKITISKAELKKYVSANKKADNISNITPEYGYYYNTDEFIIVKSGGTLVIDGINLFNGFKISLQKGAKLKLINGTVLEGCVLGVQEGAEVEINDASFDGAIINEGTINVLTPKKKTTSDSFYMRSLRSNMFLNCKTGVINLDYGRFAMGNDFDSAIEPGFVKSDMRTEKDAVVINNGTINVTGYGHIGIADSYQNHEHKESYSKTPVVNNGKININQTAKKYFEFSAFSIDHNSFYNHGTIKVTTDAVKGKYKSGSYAESCIKNNDSLYAEMQILESEFINYGTLEFDVKNGLGMAVTGLFFPTDKVIKRFEDDGETASHSRLENRKGGKVKITTNNGCAIAIGSSAYLINEGTLSVEDNGKNSKEPPVLITGKLTGKGKITGKNYIKQK
ncbi:MAG: leucine-rich repeat domain-containing protein [Lachnospiraceae bacterium]|nr:leucine-rich repeat domain-containing protein [Lachnospiraceae bacterium]